MEEKEEIFKNINHFKFLLELEKEMLDLEKSLKKSISNYFPYKLNPDLRLHINYILFPSQ